MARFNCLATLLVGKKKRSKDSPKVIDATKGNGNGNLHAKMEDIVNPYIKEVGKENYFSVSIKDLPKAIGSTNGNENGNLQAKMEALVKPSIKEVGKENHFDASIKVGTQENSPSFGMEAVGDDNLIRAETALEAAYEGGDEHEEILSMKRDFSDLDLQAQAADSGEFNSHDLNGSNSELNGRGAENKSERDEGNTPEAMFQNGHVSDPGMGRATAFWGSPILKRSCSNIESKRSSQLLMSPIKSQSYDDLLNLSGNNGGDPLNGIHGSPKSVMTAGSADKVMLKKRSSSHVLPSRSRKLWWKLFLWSHRNLHRPCTMKPQINDLGTSNQKGGYSSDTLEPIHSIDKTNKKVAEDTGNRHQTDLWHQNHWVAFSAESSSLDRVNAWVNSLEVSQSFPIEYDENEDAEERDAIVFPTSPEIGESSGRNQRPANRCPAEEVVQANNIIQSLNSFSSVAHISSMGLKIIPAISAFSSLRSINLSGNFIVHITPGTLPKSLHTLDLSKNKITAIEGLRDLTRLRVLNLSYNRISRIGHGLSNCTLIKELYLAGNKISDIEGLHRLLKLTVLDLSFNKITTAKALGQLVANYNSLLALNLLGNPIQSNIGDDQLRKAVTGLLPQLAYLNKQPIKPQRAREVANDSVARAALGNGSGWSSRRRLTRRMSQVSGSSVKGRDGGGHRGLGSVSGGGAGQKSSRHRTKSRHQHSSSGMK